MSQSKLMLRQVSSKLEALRGFKKSAAGVASWTQYIRKALGMSVHQLAQRAGLATPTIYKIERSEKSDQLTLQTLKTVAEAMDCEFVYAFVPQRPLEEMIESQAQKRAKTVIKQANLQMEYEDQTVSRKETSAQYKELVESLKSSKTLWDDTQA